MSKDSEVRHLTGSERTAVERHTGPLQNVGDRGDLVRVPEEHKDLVDGVEEITNSDVAATVYNRGVEHGAAKGRDLREKDEASQESDENRSESKGDEKDEKKSEPKPEPKPAAKPKTPLKTPAK